MEKCEDRDGMILRVVKRARGGCKSEQIRTQLGNPKMDTKKFDRSMRRLWNQCKISRIDKPNRWGRHSYYIPSRMFGHREETRLADGFFGAVMCYLEDLCQTMPFEEAWQFFIGNVWNWLQSLEDPAVKNAYRDCFNGSKQRRGSGRVRRDAVEK